MKKHKKKEQKPEGVQRQMDHGVFLRAFITPIITNVCRKPVVSCATVLSY